MKHSNYRLAPAFGPQAEAPRAARAMPAEPVSPAGMDADVAAGTEAGEATVIATEPAADAEEAEEISAAAAGPPEEVGRVSHGRRDSVTPAVRAEGAAPVRPATEVHEDTGPSVAWPAPPPGVERAAVQPEVAADETAKAARADGGVRPEMSGAATGATRILTDKAPLHAERTEETVKYFHTAPVEAAMGKAAPPTPTKGQAAKLFVRFIPPRVRRVGLPVTAAVTLSAGASFPEVAVRVETRDGLRLARAQDDCIYRGPLPAGEPKKIEFKLLADREGTHRLRVSVETPVAGLQAQMEVILPDFEAADEIAAATDALGHRVTVTFNETPLRQALLELARQGRVSLVLASTVGNERVTYSCIDTPAGSVVRILAETHGYSITAEDNSYYISNEQ